MTPVTSDILKTFIPVGLDEMDNVRLMNRVDIKYVMSAHKIPEFLKRLDVEYRVLEINDERIFSYKTVYLYTKNYLFYTQHVTGRPQRSKVRYRTCLDSGNTFLEVKKKTSGNRTMKWRIENHPSADNNCDSEAMEFLGRHIHEEDLSLQPVIINEFRRITFVRQEMNERMTVDFNLSFRCNETDSFYLPGIAILELKKEYFSARSCAAGILKDLYVYPTSFSKYCVGVSALCNVPKKNLIKSKMLLINKIENEFNSCISA